MHVHLNLKWKLSSDKNSHVDYNRFQSSFCEVLNHHAPLKKKNIRANNSPFMTKPLRKMIMNRSRSKNAYLKNKTVDNWERQINQKSEKGILSQHE